MASDYSVTEATIKLVAYLKSKPGINTEFIDSISWNIYYHVLSKEDRLVYIKEHIPFLSDVKLQKIQMYLDYYINTTVVFTERGEKCNNAHF